MSCCMFTGHVLRQDRDNDCNVAMTWAPEEKRKRGKPKVTRGKTVEEERTRGGWKTSVQVQVVAAKRSK